MVYNFKYSLTEDDFVAFNVYSLWEASWLKKNRISFTIRSTVYGIVAAVATILIINRLIPSKNDNHFPTAIFCSVGIVLLAALSYYQAPFDIKKRAKKMISSDDNRHILNETELELNDSGFVNTDIKARVEQKWSSIIRYAVTKNYFYLYTNSLQAQIIPKRLLPSQKEIDELDNFLTEKIPLSASFRSLGI